MFERNKIETSSQAPQILVPAEIVLSDGEALRGKLAVPQSKSVAELINSPAPFIEFEPYGGERLWVAKSALRQLRIVNVPAAQSLGSNRDSGGFDPYTVLKVAKTAPWEEVRQAYLALAKTYHPDRFSSVDLPAEVAEYIEATTRRINEAYRILESQQVSVKRVQERSQPIYTNRPSL